MMPNQSHPNLYNQFNRWLERYAPAGLYRRAMLILILPVLLMQLIVAGFILDRHWDNVTKVLARALSREVGILVELYNRSDKSELAARDIEKLAHDRLNLELSVLRNATLPPVPEPAFYQLFDVKMQKYLARETRKPFTVIGNGPDGMVDIQVEVQPGLIFKVRTEADRAWAANTPFLMFLMLGSTALLLSIAALFLRNQIRPILELANAAHDFGLGRDNKQFRPRGAAEIREAGQSFLDMRRRIARHVEQRTAMLAGVSHDLRTILTRFKLELAVIGDNPKVHPLKEDVDEMQHMLEDYMAFVKGDGGEQVTSVSLPEVVAATIESVERDRPDSEALFDIGVLPTQRVMLKANAVRRLLSNLIGNAARYGTRINISGEISEGRLWLHVDDNGPGIPEEEREHAFRPFVRLDNARNLDETGTGLGLAIALDIAHAHGGDIFLEDSQMGGLRATVKLPV
jgi:two-component system, OmpR family, osmolarity sensor histidine kinase EnvZ